ncbi:MAG: PaaI family thioesterase [Proteobacteria bacterium]|nr:PaaI family thioesterase [Pseudomonadota bacterium]
MLKGKSLQDTYAAHNQCFGCGPSNEKGLQVKSYVQGEEVVANWQPLPYHEAFPGILNGGVIGTLLDCHSNWSAAYFLMKKQQASSPPCTVTAYFNVSLKRPTPSDKPVYLVASIKEIKEDRALISAKLYSENKLCATCEGLFVAVKEGHPAYHRW